MMARFRFFLFIFIGGLCPSVQGEDAALAAPATGVRDDTRALTEVTREVLVREIAQVKQETGVELWFMASTFLASDQTSRTFARDLRQQWSRNDLSILMAYDRASDTQALSFSPGVWERYASAELIGLMQRVAGIMAAKESSLEQRLVQSLRAVMKEVRVLENQHRRAEVTLPKDHLRLATGFTGVVVAGALVAGLLGIALRRREVQSSLQSYFPSVRVPSRLGALFGGGVIVEQARQER